MKKEIFKFNFDTRFDDSIPQDYILLPYEDLANAITFDELLVGVKEDLKKMYQKREQYRK